MKEWEHRRRHPETSQLRKLCPGRTVDTERISRKELTRYSHQLCLCLFDPDWGLTVGCFSASIGTPGVECLHFALTRCLLTIVFTSPRRSLRGFPKNHLDSVVGLGWCVIWCSSCGSQVPRISSQGYCERNMGCSLAHYRIPCSWCTAFGDRRTVLTSTLSCGMIRHSGESSILNHATTWSLASSVFWGDPWQAGHSSLLGRHLGSNCMLI